jgi:imidazolonepropionase-like amidohydrolase
MTLRLERKIVIRRKALLGSLLVFAVFLLPCVMWSQQQDLALVGGKLYASPSSEAINDAVVLIHAGKIVKVGPRASTKLPPSAKVLDCTGRVVVAGFWNSHVHFTEDVWTNAATGEAGPLRAHMSEMFNQRGFTTVWDVGSIPQQTLPLRARVESGEIPGPRIFTTGGVIFPKNGIPIYITEMVKRLNLKFPEAGTPTEGAGIAKNQIEQFHADGIKIFTGSIEKNHVVPMDPEIVRAIAQVAHAAGKPVFAHPSNNVGVDNALQGGVDVLAHTIPMSGHFTQEELTTMKAHHVALVPTLQLFADEERKDGGSEEAQQQVLHVAESELKSFVDVGGTILFGTDVGYTTLYDATGEFNAMQDAGMSWRQILASLTTAPAAYFRPFVHHAGNGTLAEGQPADVVVLLNDPAKDVKNFGGVQYTVRAGRLIYDAAAH